MDKYYTSDAQLNEIHWEDYDKTDNTEQEVFSDYSDGVSEDYSNSDSEELVESDDIHAWATETLKHHSRVDKKKTKDKIRHDTIKDHLLQDQDLRTERKGLKGDNRQIIAEWESTPCIPSENTRRNFKTSKKNGEAAKEDSVAMDISKIVLGSCHTEDKGSCHNEDNRDKNSKPPEESHNARSLLCQFCLQDFKESEAITYCIECGLYMCATCRRYHRKFVATRGHPVAVQQEMIPTEFDRYTPAIQDNDNFNRDVPDNTLLNTHLVDSGRYSRPLTPPNNDLCGPCQYDGVREPATHFCQDCGIFLCGICYKFHQKLQRSFDHHSVIHQWDCENFDTYVPTIPEENEAVMFSNPDLYKNFIQQSGKDVSSPFCPTLQPEGRFSVKLISDPKECSVAGMDCFSDGRIVLTDENNRNVKLFNSQYQPLGSLELQGRPSDVAIVTNESAVVSVPDDSNLAFIRLHRIDLSLSRTMKTASKYIRIASKCDEIYALCKPEGKGHLWLHILNAKGNVVSFVNLDLTQSELAQMSQIPSLAISPSGGTVYVSDKNHCIFAFGLDGRKIFKHENMDMSDITDLAADSRSIYVCCKGLSSVFRVTYDGKDSSKVVSKTARIASPRTLAISRDILLVGLCDSDNVHIYSLPRI